LSGERLRPSRDASGVTSAEGGRLGLGSDERFLVAMRGGSSFPPPHPILLGAQRASAPMGEVSPGACRKGVATSATVASGCGMTSEAVSNEATSTPCNTAHPDNIGCDQRAIHGSTS
jgi:hypothetical protein